MLLNVEGAAAKEGRGRKDLARVLLCCDVVSLAYLASLIKQWNAMLATFKE
jgi:hypothetical protein